MNAEPMTQSELTALDERKRAAHGWWELSAEEVARAYAAGRRDFARANLKGANLYGANLEGANLYGANLYRANLEGANLEGANLEGAYLYRANLYRANLYGANLYRAYLINAPGVYVDYSPFLSSRNAPLLGRLVIADGTVALRFDAGCKTALTADELLAKVTETHGDNIHARHYAVSIRAMTAHFAIDMEFGKWDYLLTWVADSSESAKPIED